MTIKKGKRIKKLREAAGLSQVELAEMIGVSKQTLYKYENDIVTNIPSDKIEAMASALNVEPAIIMGWEKPSENLDSSDAKVEWYTDPETARLAQELHDNPDLRILLDASKDLSPEKLRALIALIAPHVGEDE